MEKKQISEQIVDGLRKLAQKYTMHGIFYDYVKVCAIAIQNSFVPHDIVWEQRENDYLATMEKYSNEEKAEIARLSGLLLLAYAENFSDVLGDIYMQCSMGDQKMAQFFTPYNVAVMMAAMNLDNMPATKPFTLSEPSCGSGVMVIAAADILRQRKIKYWENMFVVAQDLDWTCVYMSYIQLSMLGIKAHVIQGNSLTELSVEDPRRIFITPACHPDITSLLSNITKETA